MFVGAFVLKAMCELAQDLGVGGRPSCGVLIWRPLAGLGETPLASQN